MPSLAVTAGSEAQDGWLPLQDEMTALSTRSVHHVLPDATDASLIDEERTSMVHGPVRPVGTSCSWLCHTARIAGDRLRHVVDHQPYAGANRCGAPFREASKIIT
jgi:hypothetical protein